MLRVENNINKTGLPCFCIALFGCICVSGGGLEPFRQVVLSEGKQTTRKYNSPKWL